MLPDFCLWSYGPQGCLCLTGPHPSSRNGLSEKQDVFLVKRADRKFWIIESPPFFGASKLFIYPDVWFLPLSVLANLEG